MLNKFKYHIILFIGLIVGAIVLQSLLNSFYKSEKKHQQNELIKVQSDAVLRIETGINIYSTVISSIRAYIENSDKFPTEVELQHFLKDLVKEVNFKDSMIVSFIDTNQIFNYVVTPYQIDPAHLKGLDVSKLRPDFEIKKLNALMHQNNISLFDPINLREGWAAFPFNFAAKNKQGTILGYIAPVLNVKYLLDYTYHGGHDSLFVHRFITGNNIDLTREIVYDGTSNYNKKVDVEYYKNFNVKNEDFIYTDVKFYGLTLKVGSAYKQSQTSNHYLAIITYLWFSLLTAFCFITLFQFFKNNKLNKLLKSAHNDIVVKNNELEVSLFKIQTLIKEIHHRVKNNMQIISSLLNLQSNEQQDEKVISVLNESKRRIQSMALVHQKLYDAQDLEHIKVKDYVAQLTDSVECMLSSKIINTTKNITISDNLFFNMDTMIPLGLIVNELVTNSYKYAFVEHKINTLSIKIEEKNNNYVLIYSDSGLGIPDTIDVKNSGTLGLDLVNALTDQLDGTVSYNKLNGSEFNIKFKILFN